MMDPMSGFGIRPVFTVPLKDSTLQYIKMHTPLK